MQCPKPTAKKAKQTHPASIMQDKKECYITGDIFGLELHHVFTGSNRKNSETYGLKVWLRHDWHNEPPYGVHFDSEFMERLHIEGQMAFEKCCGSREDFVRIFGRNYLG